MAKKPNILVVIAARGGSKSVKNKNIRAIAGKPLIAHTIRQAVRWGKAGRIVCSTDSSKISAVARKYGAEIPFKRSQSLAGDRIGKVKVIRHAFKWAERHYHEKYDIIVDLDVTSPMRTIEDLNRCLKLFEKEKPKTLFSVVKAQKNPYFNMVEEAPSGRVRICKRSNGGFVRRQDTPKVYDMNASIYFYKRSYLMNERNNSPISNHSVAYVMDDVSRFDIDTPLDFELVEFLMKKRKRAHG